MAIVALSASMMATELFHVFQEFRQASLRPIPRILHEICATDRLLFWTNDLNGAICLAWLAFQSCPRWMPVKRLSSEAITGVGIGAGVPMECGRSQPMGC